MSPEEFLGTLGRMQATVEGSQEEPLRACLEPLWDGIHNNFVRAEGPDGTPWPARKDDLPHPLLVLTGALIKGATGSGGNVLTVGHDGRDITTGVDGSQVDYAIFHMTGTRYMPPRPFMYANRETVDACADVFGNAAFELFVGVI